MPETVDGYHGSLCTKCGKCCWNWVENTKAEACPFLSRTDWKTCTVFDRWEANGVPQCRNLMTIKQVSSLPDECGYVQEWLKAGKVERVDTDRWGNVRWREKVA